MSYSESLCVLLLILIAGQMLEHRKGLRQVAEHSVADSAAMAPAPSSSHTSPSAHNTVPLSRQSSSLSASSVRSRDPDYDNLDQLESELRECEYSAAMHTLAAGSSLASSHAAETPEERKACLEEEDRVAVEDEFRRYKSAALEDKRVDLLIYWQVRLTCNHWSCITSSCIL